MGGDRTADTEEEFLVSNIVGENELVENTSFETYGKGQRVQRVCVRKLSDREEALEKGRERREIHRRSQQRKFWTCFEMSKQLTPDKFFMGVVDGSVNLLDFAPYAGRTHRTSIER